MWNFTSRGCRAVSIRIHDNDVPQAGKLLADLADLVDVFLLGDDRRGAGVLQPHQERFFSESGEQRLRHGSRLQDAEEADVQLGHTVHEQTDPLAGLNAELRRETARRCWTERARSSKVNRC